MVERDFPNASQQVILFSTDTEVDRKRYQDLQPYIARVYHLYYDERDRRTAEEEILLRQFRLRLHRGIGYLATPQAIRSIADLVQFAVTDEPSTARSNTEATEVT